MNFVGNQDIGFEVKNALTPYKYLIIAKSNFFSYICIWEKLNMVALLQKILFENKSEKATNNT